MRLSRVTIGLAFVTITLAVTTVWLANRDLRSDKAWQNLQIELLREQIRVNEELSEKLEMIITSQAMDVQATPVRTN